MPVVPLLQGRCGKCAMTRIHVLYVRVTDVRQVGLHLDEFGCDVAASMCWNIYPLNPSVQCRRVVVIARLEVLLSQYFEAQFCLDTFKDHVFIDASGNGNITICTVVIAHAKWISSLPERIVIKAFKPFFKIGSVFKLLHGFRISQSEYGYQRKPSKLPTDNVNGRFVNLGLLQGMLS